MLAVVVSIIMRPTCPVSSLNPEGQAPESMSITAPAGHAFAKLLFGYRTVFGGVLPSVPTYMFCWACAARELQKISASSRARLII
jgi:hypothetical protein